MVKPPTPRGLRLESLDLFTHANPALVACVVHWLADGHQDQRRKDSVIDQTGMPILWAIAGTSMVLTKDIRGSLPKTSAKRLTTLFHEHPRWRPRVAGSIAVWQRPFWRGVGYGAACGVVTLEEGRVHARGRMGATQSDWQTETRRLSRALGKVFAKETATSALHGALGLEVSVGENG